MKLLGHSEFVHLVVVQEDVDVLIVYAEELEGISCPIDFIVNYFDQECFNLL